MENSRTSILRKKIYQTKNTLTENNENITDDAIFFSEANLEVEGYLMKDVCKNIELNTVANIITKFKNYRKYPSE